MRTINDSKCLASLAIFKRLCDEGHKNIYEVLREFIKVTIYRHGFPFFSEASLTEAVSKAYGFNLKAAMEVSAIKEFFICDRSDLENEFEKQHLEQQLES